MGISVCCSSSFWLNMNPKQQCRFAKISGNQKRGDDLKITGNFRKAQTQSTRSICCKLQGTDFEERTSPAEIASLLDATTWSGAGPGLMDAVTKGALEAGKPVGGFKIGKEAGQWTATDVHPYLPLDSYLTCRFFSARKHGLVDAGVRAVSSDRTAFVALPGGIGTLDEVFEVSALIQLERIGSMLPVPFLVMNYDSFYSKLLGFIDDCEGWGTVSKGEVASLWRVCNTNAEALAYLAEYYGLPDTEGYTSISELGEDNGIVSSSSKIDVQ
ncbi:probable cytokinin riboside 5'-monophosphate phosphoribohydrolase LOGL3 isoform X2 [Salvia splendens]|uniref:probable cytokinin riboside 5'-monophosphate phosphoribohydrolase LOGL3 isoform X2 n=1 Tax=Salvia splendens TaxID=180675 RepID=UPI001C26F06A|nr:probable cytokinin riboside 5'-monophosphate phosphoribohydrolase LOGL3 isoform X2 [Salvia splendens]